MINHNNKKTNLVFVIVAMLISVNFAQAQQKRRQGPPPLPNDEQIEKMVTNLSNELSLTEEQEKQISELYFQHFEKAGEMREENKQARQADREKMEQFRTDFEKEVKLHLSKDQQKQFDDYVKEKRNERRKQQGHSKNR